MPEIRPRYVTKSTDSSLHHGCRGYRYVVCDILDSERIVYETNSVDAAQRFALDLNKTEALYAAPTQDRQPRATAISNNKPIGAET